MLRLPPVLRPRLTVKYVLCSVVVIYVLYCFLFSSPLFASNLSRYTGPHEVGTIDIEAPCEERSISDFKLKGSGDPAFPLSTVLFSLYYPAKNVKTITASTLLDTEAHFYHSRRVPQIRQCEQLHYQHHRNRGIVVAGWGDHHTRQGRSTTK